MLLVILFLIGFMGSFSCYIYNYFSIYEFSARKYDLLLVYLLIFLLGFFAGSIALYYHIPIYITLIVYVIGYFVALFKIYNL